MKVLSLAILLAAWLVTPQQLPSVFLQQVTSDQTRTGAISGTIVGPESNSAAGVTVLASLQEPDPGFHIKTFTSRSDNKGHFEFRSLPIGIYRLEISPKDKWLYKQIAIPVIIRDSRSTAVDLRLQFINQCDGQRSQDLTSSDKAAIIGLVLEEAVTRKKIPSYPRLVSDNKVILSTKNVDATNQISSPRGFELVLLSPSEIQARANRQGDLMYLEFEKIELQGSCVAVSLCHLWADGTSTIETGPKVLLGEGYIYYVFHKRAGTWTGEFITGWIS